MGDAPPRALSWPSNTVFLKVSVDDVLGRVQRTLGISPKSLPVRLPLVYSAHIPLFPLLLSNVHATANIAGSRQHSTAAVEDACKVAATATATARESVSTH